MARKIGGLNRVPWKWVGLAIGGGAALMSFIPVVRRRAMKVTNILKKDHRVVSGMILALEMTPQANGTVRKGLFTEIQRQLTVHAQAEEEVFYPAVRNLNFGFVEQYVNDSYREHDNIKSLLSEISGIDPSSYDFDRKVADLRRTIQHHVEDEEGKIFPMLERQMSSEQLERLGQRIHNKKNDLKKQWAA